MKRVVSLMIISLFFTLQAQTDHARILVDLDINTPQIDSVKTAATGTLLVGIVCQKVVNLDAYSFDVAFNPAVLSFQSAVEDNLLAGMNNILKKNGGQTLNVHLGLKIGCTDTININNTLVGSDSAVAPDGEGLMGIILFNVLQAVPCSLTVHSAVLVDYEGVIDTSLILSKGRIIPPTFARASLSPAGKNNAFATVRTAVVNHSPFDAPAATIFDIRGRVVSRSSGAVALPSGMFVVKKRL